MTGEDFMRLADDGCPHCPEHYPFQPRVIVIREVYPPLPEWMIQAWRDGSFKLSVDH